MIGSLVLVLGLSCVALAGPGKLPAEIPRCRRTEPNLDDCLRKAIQTSIPYVIEGIPKLGVFPLDPLKIVALDISQGSGPVAIDLKFRDILLSGLKNASLSKVTSDLKNYKLELQGFFESPLVMDALYDVNGKVLILPIRGQGKSHLTLQDVKFTLLLNGSELKKDGRTYMHLNSLDVDFTTTRLHMKFERFRPEERDLVANLNVFLNENWEEIFKELYPAIKHALGEAFKEIVSRILTKVPYDDIFLP